MMTDFDTLEDLQQADPLLREIQRLRAALEAAPLASDIGMQYWTEYVSWYNGQRNQALEQE
ncbi:MAG: hypothetical protein ACYS8I_16900 [Planctomycetota bacterium]|jgi:hypothetical protein